MRKHSWMQSLVVSGPKVQSEWRIKNTPVSYQEGASGTKRCILCDCILGSSREKLKTQCNIKMSLNIIT